MRDPALDRLVTAVETHGGERLRGRKTSSLCQFVRSELATQDVACVVLKAVEDCRGGVDERSVNVEHHMRVAHRIVPFVRVRGGEQGLPRRHANGSASHASAAGPPVRTEGPARVKLFQTV